MLEVSSSVCKCLPCTQFPFQPVAQHRASHLAVRAGPSSVNAAVSQLVRTGGGRQQQQQQQRPVCLLPELPCDAGVSPSPAAVYLALSLHYLIDELRLWRARRGVPESLARVQSIPRGFCLFSLICGKARF